MKTIWSKIPAWLKALLINFTLLYPMVYAMSYLIRTNITSGISWGWAIIPLSLLQVVFWYLTKRFNPYKGDGFIQQSLKFKGQRKALLQVSGIMLFSFGALFLLILLLPNQENATLNAILSFRAMPAQLAIPLLIGMAIHAGVSEELIFRCLMQNTLNDYTRWIRFMLVGLIFAFSHQIPLILIIPYLLVSMTFSYVADQQRSLGVVIIAHVMLDASVFLGLYFGFINVSDPNNSLVWICILSVIMGSGLLIIYGLPSSKQRLHSYIFSKIGKTKY